MQATEEQSADLAARIEQYELRARQEAIFMRLSDAYPGHFVFVEPESDREYRVWRVSLVGPLPEEARSRGIWARQTAELVADELENSRAAGVAVWQGTTTKATLQGSSDVRFAEDRKFRYYLQAGELVPTTRFEFPPPPMTSMEQVLRLVIPLSDGDFGSDDELQRLSELETRLQSALMESGAGRIERNESVGGIFTIYSYGASARVMLDVLRPILQSADLPEGSAAVLPGGFSGFVHTRVPL